MERILDGSLEIGADVMSDLGYLICSRLSFRSSAVSNQIFFCSERVRIIFWVTISSYISTMINCKGVEAVYISCRLPFYALYNQSNTYTCFGYVNTEVSEHNQQQQTLIERMLDGYSVIGTDVMSDLSYLICSRLSSRSSPVTNLIKKFLEKICFPFCLLCTIVQSI